jgi:hypothetical protein
LVSSPYQSAKTIYISVSELKALYEEAKKSDPKLAGRIEGYYGTKLGMFIGGSVATAPIGGVMAKAIKQSSAARKVAQKTAALNRIGNNQAQPKTVAANQAINNKLSDSYLNQQATKQVGQVTVPIRFNEHIINGEVKKGKLTGGHSIHGNLTIVSRGQPNRYGVYEAEISIPKPNDPSKILTKKSTMFPDSWTPDRIKVEVNAAYNNRTSVPNRPGMWQGTTPSGIAVAGYTHPDLTVYPLRGGLIR